MNLHINSIDFSEHSVHWSWSHCILTLCKQQLSHAKWVGICWKFGRACSFEVIMEAVIWSQTLSLLDKCQAWMCEHPLAFGLVWIIHKWILLKCHIELCFLNAHWLSFLTLLDHSHWTLNTQILGFVCVNHLLKRLWYLCLRVLKRSIY